MSEVRVIRPSFKLVAVSYIVTILILVAAAWGLYSYIGKEPNPWHLLALLLLLIPLRKHIKARLVSLAIDSDHLTIESGLLSRARRTVDLAKVQDVTVRQTFTERLLGIGDLTLESAGEKSSMSMDGIDSPRKVADLILARSRELTRLRAHGGTL